MLEFLPSNEDVVAVRCSGRFTHAEIDSYMDRIEASFAARDKTHLYAEVIDFSGFETDRFLDTLKRSGPWLGKLDRIGRVAIVADQDWIRWLAKVESAVLPHVSYETFKSDERDRALAWVEGRLDSPHAAAIKVIETDTPDVFGFEIDGHAGKAELDAISAHFLKAIEGKDKVSFLGRLRNLGGFQFGGLLTGDYFALKREALQRLERYAVVGGPPWIRTMLNTLSPLFKAEIRHFEPEEEEAAWAWLGARPASERTLVS
ncbi:STAS/SEC14 domain-containing protein [Sphingosinicella sp. LHD-64]|uniref:STAS/SEC14 domain-containing protein n=1 Tax=Sphingosinicella sp. LHD-64 TaxID=3072139 RepID=UPI002810262C|nr:STAS/SEC14 domain-containing protein [Sphingosinicella sp. LHD-64]MDQ8755140.1 STAS/SEC14 domain-containing protein [Sphingosinicella sp. LHD-64]